MIIVQIDNNSGIMSVSEPEQFPASGSNRMMVGKRVDLSVKEDPFADSKTIVLVFSPFHKVGDEVSYEEIFIITTQK